MLWMLGNAYNALWLPPYNRTHTHTYSRYVYYILFLCVSVGRHDFLFRKWKYDYCLFSVVRFAWHTERDVSSNGQHYFFFVLFIFFSFCSLLPLMVWNGFVIGTDFIAAGELQSLAIGWERENQRGKHEPQKKKPNRLRLVTWLKWLLPYVFRICFGFGQHCCAVDRPVGPQWCWWWWWSLLGTK